MKYKILIGGMCAALIWYYQIENKRLTELSSHLKTNQNQILLQLKRSYRNHVALQNKNTKLSRCAKAEKTFDWYADISTTDVVKQLQKD